MKCKTEVERKSLGITLSTLGKEEGRLRTIIARIEKCDCPACVSVIKQLKEIRSLGK